MEPLYELALEKIKHLQYVIDRLKEENRRLKHIIDLHHMKEDVQVKAIEKFINTLAKSEVKEND